MHFRPLGERVVVRRVDEETKTKGGIIIPDTAQGKAAGRRNRRRRSRRARRRRRASSPLEVKAGDRILFGKWSGTEVKVDGEELLIMKESDIMGVVEGDQDSTQKAA